MRKKIFIIIVIFLCFYVFMFLCPAFAQVKFKPQVDIPGFEVGVEKEVTPTTLAEFIVNFYTWSIRAIAILAAVMIMVAGFQWMLAAGSAPQVSQAKDRMFSSLIGLILALGAYTLLNFLNPALVRFRELSPETIAKKALVWCTELTPDTHVKNLGTGEIKAIDDIAARCNEQYQVVQKDDKGKWQALPENYCWGHKCTDEFERLVTTQNCTRLTDKSFTCLDLTEICNGKPGLSQEDCSAYLANTYLGVYDDFVCVFDPCWNNNCMLAMKMHCPDDPCTLEKETKRTSCVAAGPPCYAENMGCHCYGIGCNPVAGFIGGGWLFHKCTFCCTDSPNAGAIKNEICCQGDLSEVGLLADSFYHCYAWNEGRQGDPANPLEYWCEDKNGNQFNFFKGIYSTWINGSCPP